MLETLRLTCEPINRCDFQAEFIAKAAFIELDTQQKSRYAELRMLDFDPVYDSEHGPGLWSLSDQQLLYLTLRPEQQTAFEIKYSHIDFGKALECYMKWGGFGRPAPEPITQTDDLGIIERIVA